ncbi:PREDICTED: uncharacterized protein LOC109583143 [Amphimedon queenslandica]|uniref:Uncharacterized protein n=1 Tax=Amphimedon queenslandica TaxID=400682 RepID=A0A1X7UIK2_AMPQE|nr:PREDICTED: uncharacterized protein LOC109583143 [Amphimedon queenslandica]|eukprot:XP_019853913.1 PREDICTED: uncharacterized protein LOC109583143 [Amphimedon queenslandica]
MGNCCGCRSEERLRSPVSKEGKEISFTEEVEEQQKPLVGDPEPTPKRNSLGIDDAVVIDIVYYEDPTPAVPGSCTKVDEDSVELAATETTGATFDCDHATEQIRQCLDKTVQVSITKVTGFKKRCETGFTKPKTIIKVTVAPETQSQWPDDGSTLEGQLKTKIETEWNSQLKKDYFALITMKKQQC